MCMLHLYNKNKCLKHFKYTTPCKIKTTQVFYLYFSNTEKGTHRPQKYFFEFSIFSVFGNTVTFHSPHVFDKTHTFPPTPNLLCLGFVPNTVAGGWRHQSMTQRM